MKNTLCNASGMVLSKDFESQNCYANYVSGECFGRLIGESGSESIYQKLNI